MIVFKGETILDAFVWSSALSNDIFDLWFSFWWGYHSWHQRVIMARFHFTSKNLFRGERNGLIFRSHFGFIHFYSLYGVNINTLFQL